MGQRKIYIYLIICSLLITSVLFIALDRLIEGVSVKALSAVGTLLSVSSPSEKSIVKFKTRNRDSLIRLTFFDKDLKLLSGEAFPNSQLIRQDMQFALRSGLKIDNFKAGYQIVPTNSLVAVVSINDQVLDELLVHEWPFFVFIFFIIMTLLFVLVRFFPNDATKVSKYRDFLNEIVQVSEEVDFKELLFLIKEKLTDLKHTIYELERENSALKSEIQHLKRALRKTTQDLEATQDYLLRAGTLSALGEFAAGISHELNNPIGIVLGFTQHLLDEVSQDHPHYKKLKRMEIELIRCQRILQDLLAFARPQQPALTLVDVNRLVKGTVQFVFYPGTEGIEVVCNFEEDLPPIQVDPDQLEQVLINLLKNSVQAIDDGQGKIVISTATVTLTHEDTVMLSAPVVQPGALLMEGSLAPLSVRVPRIEGKVKVGDEAIKIEITDNGCGINPQDLQKIFTPFYTTKKNGTGLGLSICWKLIRRNGGILKVRSNPGEGSTFIIIFPLDKERQDHEANG